MRGQLPIIIAVVILGGLIIASLFYVTAVTMYTRSLSSGAVKDYWDILDQELDTLNLVALKYASAKAYHAFETTFDSIYNEIEPSSTHINDKNKLLPEQLKTGNGDDIDQFSYGITSSYDFYQALSNFKESLHNSCLTALDVLEKNVLDVIYNWIFYKTREGFSVNITYFKPFYNITLWNDGYISYGRGSIGFNIKYFIVAPDGEYREFVKSINATYIMSFDSGYPYGFRNMTLPIRLGTFLTINGKEYSYMQPSILLKIRIYSILFQSLPSLTTASNGLEYVDLIPEKTMYLENGIMEAYYKLTYGTTEGIAAIDLVYDVIDILVPTYGNHYYFLWATISVADIDGIKVPSALKLVFIYDYREYWYIRIIKIRIYGDENRPITPIT